MVLFTKVCTKKDLTAGPEKVTTLKSNYEAHLTIFVICTGKENVRILHQRVLDIGSKN
jgi:isopentenyl diphosphate isomerase/L-lactate dehydrogenase-like FMN-dependent dehydrogenase